MDPDPVESARAPLSLWTRARFPVLLGSPPCRGKIPIPETGVIAKVSRTIRLPDTTAWSARLRGSCLPAPIVLLALFTPNVGAQQPLDPRLPADRKTITAERLQEGERVSLDGRLDEPAWQRAVAISDFVQQDPVLGSPPTEHTEIRIVFDRENLYIGALFFDSEPDRLLGNTMKRDEFLSADDRFMWTIDTFLDQQTGYFFEMNPSGLMADALMLPGGGNERGWDGIWNARVVRSEIGWTVEIQIPFRTLNFDPDAPAWGINFQRTVRRKNEELLWMGHERNQGLRRMSNAGLLLGIRDVTQGRGLDLKPYIASTTTDSRGTSPAGPRATTTDVGVDLFYNLTPSLRANLTVNTDFAQTEVDQRLVNLDRFPVRFPEKRDFFLDGAAFFSFHGSEPFFSRRIGLDAQGHPQRIDGGIKLTGQAGDQDVGFLHVRTGSEGVAPAEDFSVFRVRRRLLSQSYVGSFVSRRQAHGDVPSDDLFTAGADLRLATSSFRGSENLSLGAFFLWTTNPADTGENLSFGVQLDYPNDPWSGGVSFTEVQDEFDPAIGFTPRRGFRGYSPSVSYTYRPSTPRIRQVTFGGDLDLRTDLENQTVTRVLALNAFSLQTASLDNFSLRISPSREVLVRDFTIHPGVVLPAGSAYDFTRVRFQVGTASRRVLSTSSSLEVGSFYSGNRETLALNFGLRPARGIVVNFASEWNRVDLPEGRFDTRLFRIVADTQFSPWMYVVNNVQYDSVSESIGWQIRYRWTVAPGNDLYLVYTHNWIEHDLEDRFLTQDRRGAAKFVYTYRW